MACTFRGQGMREEIEKLKDENASIRDKHSRALLQMSDTHVQVVIIFRLCSPPFAPCHGSG